MYVIYGNELSTTLARILVCFLELGLQRDKDFRLVRLEWDDIMKPEYAKAHQPFGQMPYLVDEEAGLELYESRPVIQYVARKIGSPLMPPNNDLEATARFEMAASIEQNNFNGFAEQLHWELKYKEFFTGEKANGSVVKDATTYLSRRIGGYDILLGRQKYLGGDKLTLADLYHLPNGAVTVELGVIPNMTDGSCPNFKRWWDEISARESWKRAQEMAASLTPAEHPK